MHRIIKEDCLKVLHDMPDNSVDLVVTDPPYEFAAHGGGGAFGSKKRQYHNDLEEAKITTGFDKRVLDELRRVMKKVNIYIWCNKEQIRDYLNYFSDCHIDIITWHKTNPVPTCNNKYLSDTEYCLFFREDGVKVYGTYATKKKFYVTPTNKKDKELYKHPSIKPLEIIKNLIINSSKEGDMVCDPFMGSGTTGAAAIELGRNFTGCEINQEWFDIAVKRIEDTESGH